QETIADPSVGIGDRLGELTDAVSQFPILLLEGGRLVLAPLPMQAAHVLRGCVQAPPEFVPLTGDASPLGVGLPVLGDLGPDVAPSRLRRLDRVGCGSDPADVEHVPHGSSCPGTVPAECRAGGGAARFASGPPSRSTSSGSV